MWIFEVRIRRVGLYIESDMLGVVRKYQTDEITVMYIYM